MPDLPERAQSRVIDPKFLELLVCPVSKTALEYDAAGEITKVTAPDGSFLAYSWSDAKRLTTVTNTAGETIEYGYNGNGDRTATTVKAAGGADWV